MMSKVLTVIGRRIGQGRPNGVKLFHVTACQGEAASQQRSNEGLRNASKEPLTLSQLPEEAKVVICGGGAQGAAIAYKLAQRGWGPNTVLIDKSEFGKGTTLHSSGLAPLLKQSPVETKLSKISKELYMEIEEKGYYTGWKRIGSLYLGQTDERMHYFSRVKSNAVVRGVDCEIIKADQILEKCPILNVEDIKGGLWVPGDGLCNPLEICFALLHLACEQGVRLVQHCEVQEVMNENGCVYGVNTNQGFIKCENFVNAAGFWSRYVGTLSYPRVQIPQHPAEHYILHTKPIPNLPTGMPVVRDTDGHIYIKENEGRILSGAFEKISKPAFENGLTPADIGDGRIPLDWDHYYTSLENLLHRVPSLNTALFERLTNDPEPFSPDGEWILGETSEIRRYFVAAGMRSSGAGAAGGVGELIADFITKGRTPFDMYNLDIQRFLPAHNNRMYLRERVAEVPGRLFKIPYPFLEYQTGTALRTSPIFTKLKQAGARFNQVMGYERPMYFEPDTPVEPQTSGFHTWDEESQSLSVPLAKSDTFFKPSWFDRVQEEVVASREACSLCDYTSFAKVDVSSGGSEVVDFLQKLCSNDIDIPIGAIVHSGMQNPEGGYQNDFTLARLAVNRFLLMSPSIQQMRSYTWMRNHLPSDGSVFLQDMTSLYTSLCLMGPNSKAVLSTLTDTDLNTLPNYTINSLDISCAPDVLTMTLTHTGEQGYVFYIPNEYAVHVFESLVEAGQPFGLKQCGYYAMRALRIEKFYAFWGQDLDSQSTPLECGRLWRTKTKSDIDFIGREALQKQMTNGIHKMLVMLLLDPEHNYETDPWPWGGEPIYRDGKFVGSVTTASYGFSLKRHVAIGFINNFNEKGEQELVTRNYVKSGHYEIEIAGVRYPVSVRLNNPVIPNRISGAHQYEVTTKHD